MNRENEEKAGVLVQTELYFAKETNYDPYINGYLPKYTLQKEHVIYGWENKEFSYNGIIYQLAAIHNDYTDEKGRIISHERIRPFDRSVRSYVYLDGAKGHSIIVETHDEHTSVWEFNKNKHLVKSLGFQNGYYDDHPTPYYIIDNKHQSDLEELIEEKCDELQRPIFQVFQYKHLDMEHIRICKTSYHDVWRSSTNVDSRSEDQIFDLPF